MERMIKEEIKYFLKKHRINILVFCGLVIGYYYFAINQRVGIPKQYHPKLPQTIQNQNQPHPAQPYQPHQPKPSGLEEIPAKPLKTLTSN
jgi:hypothetical protein